MRIITIAIFAKDALGIISKQRRDLRVAAQRLVAQYDLNLDTATQRYGGSTQRPVDFARTITRASDVRPRT